MPFARGCVLADSQPGWVQFGAVVAVSRAGSPRRESLVWAANITEIDITIPLQPTWTEDDVERLRAEKDSRISRGSALAWLGHLNALKWFLETDLDTVLVLEDDVDWDIHLRTYQIPNAAGAIRQLVRDQTNPPGLLYHDEKRNNFWGDVSAWDILYLGHCGDIFRPSSWTDAVPRLMYEDQSLPPRREMHPFTGKFLETIGVPEQRRIIHQSIFPLCTFGFALTRKAAYRLLHEIAPKEASGGTMAYDVRVLEGCRDLGLRCWSANPEMFHHMDMDSEIAQAEKGPDAPLEDVKPLRLGKAPNIACGARSNQFFTREEKSLEFLREKVGREGICLRDPEETEYSKLPPVEEPYTGPGDPRMKED